MSLNKCINDIPKNLDTKTYQSITNYCIKKQENEDMKIDFIIVFVFIAIFGFLAFLDYSKKFEKKDKDC